MDDPDTKHSFWTPPHIWQQIKGTPWEAGFLAGNCFEAIKCRDDITNGVVSAKWFLDRLMEQANSPSHDPAGQALTGEEILDNIRKAAGIHSLRLLTNKLTKEELVLLGFPECFEPIPV